MDDSIEICTGENKEVYRTEITQSKNNNGFILVVTAYGSRQFKQNIINALKAFDWDDENDNTIYVSDIHGCDVLKPDYEAPDAIVKTAKKRLRKRLN